MSRKSYRTEWFDNYLNNAYKPSIAHDTSYTDDLWDAFYEGVKCEIDKRKSPWNSVTSSLPVCGFRVLTVTENNKFSTGYLCKDNTWFTDRFGNNTCVKYWMRIPKIRNKE